MLTDCLYINPHPELQTLLSELGIVPSCPDELTREDCDAADVAFDFFAAFASLNKTSLPEDDNIATRLFEPTDNYNSMLQRQARIDAAPDFDYYASDGAGFDFVFDWFSRKKEAPTTTELSAQEIMDMTLDEEETNALISALYLLDDCDNADSSGLLCSPLSVIQRMNDMADNPCWLEPENLQVGLFSLLNGANTYAYTLEQIVSHFDDYSAYAKAIELECPYLPSMVDFCNGLFFKPEVMPEEIQEATTSVPKLLLDNGSGSGIVLSPNHILTAMHVIDDDLEEGSVTLRIKHDQQISPKLTAQLIPLNVPTKDKAPDL